MKEGRYSDLKPVWHLDAVRELRESGHTTPPHIQLIISDLCNHDCDFCAYRMSGYTSNQNFGVLTDKGLNNNPNRKIPKKKCFEILKDAAGMGVKAVEFTGGGEPTVHPDHIKIFRYALETCGLSCALVTNGNRLKDGWKDVLPFFDWVRVSIDAGRPETYSKIRRVTADRFSKALENVHLLSREIIRNNSKCHLGVSFVVTEKNYREIELAAKLAQNSGAHSIRFAPLFSNDEERYYDGISGEISEGIEAATQAVSGSFRVINQFPDRLRDLALHRPTYKRCGYQHFNVYIGGDLNVYRCCNTAYNDLGLVGSLKAQSFKEFWASEEKKEAYSGFDARRCARCAFHSKNLVINYVVDEDPVHVDFA